MKSLYVYEVRVQIMVHLVRQSTEMLSTFYGATLSAVFSTIWFFSQCFTPSIKSHITKSQRIIKCEPFIFCGTTWYLSTCNANGQPNIGVYQLHCQSRRMVLDWGVFMAVCWPAYKHRTLPTQQVQFIEIIFFDIKRAVTLLHHEIEVKAKPH